MKKLHFDRIPWLRLCYGAVAVVWLLWGLFCLADDALARAGGTLKEMPYSLADFTLVNMEQVDTNVLVTTSDDPQMHLNTTGLTVRNLVLTATYSDEPREMCLYYTTAEGQDFSQDRRVYAQTVSPGVYCFQLPHGKITSIRLDPCSNELTMTGVSITLNTPTGIGGYLWPSWFQWFCFALYPALAAAVLSWLEAIVKRLISVFSK